MKRPEAMTPAEWAAFAQLMRRENLDVEADHADDVAPWLAVWRAAVHWGKTGVLS